ncbi:MAG: alanyl-tRNA editing protein [Betaproteobacteria bacterium]|nr:alanyl-tRNA editing protein [Betaproteobacteria bacterium]
MNNSQRRLYYHNDAFEYEGTVLKCIGHEGGFIAALDDPLFHPQGGGQPGDTGWLDNTPVLNTKVMNDEIWLWVASPVVPGKIIQRVNIERRHHHSLLHTSGHLLGNAGQLIGLEPIKAHHWPGECKVTFRGKLNASIDVEIFQRLVDELLSSPSERKVTMNGSQREVSFGTLPSFACGGTHLTSTIDIGRVNILAVKFKNGECSVSYDAVLSVQSKTPS